jgi:hypothetical protein
MTNLTWSIKKHQIQTHHDADQPTKIDKNPPAIHKIHNPTTFNISSKKIIHKKSKCTSHDARAATGINLQRDIDVKKNNFHSLTSSTREREAATSQQRVTSRTNEGII